MDDSQNPTPSGALSDGCGGGKSPEERQEIQSQSAGPASTAVATFINRRNGAVTVSIDWAYGGYSNATLRYQGDRWDIHCRTVAPYDVYCWSTAGPCTPNGSLQCIGGRTYYVG